jgi:hypothetical protein
LAFGAFWYAAFYLVSGVQQFGEIDLRTFGVRGAFNRVPELLLAFGFQRSVMAGVFAMLLHLLRKKDSPKYAVALLGMSLAAVLEVLAAWPFTHTWVENIARLIATWPEPPSYGGPPSMVIRVTIAYLAPAILAGLMTSLVATNGWLRHEAEN